MTAPSARPTHEKASSARTANEKAEARARDVASLKTLSVEELGELYIDVIFNDVLKGYEPAVWGEIAEENIDHYASALHGKTEAELRDFLTGINQGIFMSLHTFLTFRRSGRARGRVNQSRNAEDG